MRDPSSAGRRILYTKAILKYFPKSLPHTFRANPVSIRRGLLTHTATAPVTTASVQVAHLIDVVMYRGSDTLYGWVFDSLQLLGLKLVAIASGALSVVAESLAPSTTLERMQVRRAADRGTAAAHGDWR
jgi:hypothetical protein